MNESEIKIGQKVKNLQGFFQLPIGTIGYIVKDYGTGILVGWDLPQRPYPYIYTPNEVGEMFTADPRCPLRDGFDKETELQFLEVAPEEL